MGGYLNNMFFFRLIKKWQKFLTKLFIAEKDNFKFRMKRNIDSRNGKDCSTPSSDRFSPDAEVPEPPQKVDIF